MRVYRFEQPIAESLTPKGDRKSPSRRVWFALLAAFLVLLVAFAGGLWALGRPLSGYPVGTTVDGVDIGKKTRAQAAVAVEAHGQRVIDEGLTITYQGSRFRFDTRFLQLRPRVPEALDAASADLGFIERVEVRLGRYEAAQVPLFFAYDARSFARSMIPVRQAVNREPVSAIAERTAGTIRVTAAVDGVAVDGPELRRAVRDLSQSGPDIEVPVRITEPDITTEEAEAAAEDARLYMETPHVVVLGQARRAIPRGVVRASVGFDARGGRLAFVIRQPVYRSWFGRVFKNRERPARNAIFTADEQGRARVIAGKNGRGVNVPAFVAVLQKNPGQRVIPIEIGPREPELTTAEARNMGVTRVVGEFTTPYSGGARVTNIKLAAKILDQLIIPAGGTFSLNDALGQRTKDRGFVEAPMIGENNKLVDAVGGGVSQVATTIFNAAFFSGLKIISHTPHSFWISRYPKGREATDPDEDYDAAMANPATKHPQNAPGPYYIDDSCIDCDQCRDLAPEVFGRDDETGLGYVIRQPVTADEIADVEEAREMCAVESIGKDGT
jgi:vancomycin resistance protein YoaR/ferredoxin